VEVSQVEFNRSSKEIQALVVGAGPTGLTMANELARSGVRFRIIDKAPQPSQQSKALVLQVRTQEIFGQMGLMKEAGGLGRNIRRVRAYMEGDPMVNLDFQELESPFHLPLILEQSHTESLLLKSLAAKGFQVEREVEMEHFTQSETGVRVHLIKKGLKTEDLEVPWLLGCDGAHSTVRQTLDLPFPGAPYPETFVLADIKVQGSLPTDELSIFLKHEGVMAVFPMHDQNRFRVIGMRQEDNGAEDREVSLQEIQAMVEEYAPHLGRARDPIWMAAFRLHRRAVPQYRVGRVFLSGDAAHIHSPVGGQGMNTGLQDAANLAWKLALVIQDKALPEILDSYHLERHPVAHNMMNTTDRMFEIVASKNPLLHFFRNHIFPHVAPAISKLAGKKFTEFISELQVNYRNSPIVFEELKMNDQKLKEGPRAGERAPDGRLCRANDGHPLQLFELFKDPRHTLLLFLGKTPFYQKKELLKQWENLVKSEWSEFINAYVLTHDSVRDFEEIDLGNKFLDRENKVANLYGVEDTAIYLIRPDGYVAYRAPGWDLQRLKQYFKKYYRFSPNHG